MKTLLIMLAIIGIILIVIWIIGLFAHIAGGFIHLILVIAAIAFIMHFMNRPTNPPAA